jgi:predicted nucleic-acid-binding protein
MTAVDTNVLVRLMTQDDRRQAARAEQLFRREQIWIAKTVVLETAWVLRKLYEFDSTAVCRALRALITLEGVEVEEFDAVNNALTWCERGLDFADAMHLASRGLSTRFATLDVKLASRAGRISGVETLRL